jgi:HEAT repeat protein
MNRRWRIDMDLKSLEQTPSWEWPEGTNDFLLQVLQDAKSDPEDRLLAADLAGDYVVVNDRLAGCLLSLVGDNSESDDMRCRAAIALGPALEHADIEGFDDPDEIVISGEMFQQIRQTLRTLYFEEGTSPDVRRRILEAAVRSPEDWHRDAILSAHRSDREDWRLTAAFCMQYVSGFDEQILQSIGSDNLHIAIEAVLAAGNWELEEAWTHVSSLVADENTDKTLLMAAIESAASIRPKDAHAVLGHLLDSDDEEIVETAMEALALAESHPDLLDYHDEDEEYEEDPR